MNATIPPSGADGRPRSRSALLLNAVLLAGGLAFLAPALEARLPLVEVVLHSDRARVAFGVVGVIAVGLVTRSVLRMMGGIRPGVDDVARGWRRARRLIAPVAGLLALAGMGAPLLDAAIGDYAIVRGGWIFWTFGIVCLLLALALSWNPERHIRRQQLQEGEGVRGVATIEDFEDTGWTINENPRVRLRLRIVVDGREPYLLEHTETLSRLSVGRLVIGERLPVLVHPEHPDVLEVLWKERA